MIVKTTNIFGKNIALHGQGKIIAIIEYSKAKSLYISRVVRYLPIKT